MDHMSASELADLIGCRPNQRMIMARWLDRQHWKYVIDNHGLPKVARAYYNRKMGISDEKIATKHAETPNLQAFS